MDTIRLDVSELDLFAEISQEGFGGCRGAQILKWKEMIRKGSPEKVNLT